MVAVVVARWVAGDDQAIARPQGGVFHPFFSQDKSGQPLDGPAISACGCPLSILRSFSTSAAKKRSVALSRTSRSPLLNMAKSICSGDEVREELGQALGRLQT